MLGCYSFPMHVLVHHPGVEDGVQIRTVREALADTYDVTYALGCPVLGGEDADIEAAVAVAADAEVCVVVLGDQAGLFGKGTSGEGCDVADLDLPGRQEELLEALLATGTPVVAVLLVGRPYDLSRQVDRLAGLVCGFFPGEEGAQAIADVLSGRVNPSGRLPVSFPGAGVDPARRRTSPPRWAGATRSAWSTRRRSSRSGTASRTPRATWGAVVHVVGLTSGRPTAPASSWCSSRTRPTGTCPRWCRSTSTTGRPRWCARCSSSSARPRRPRRRASARGSASRCSADLTSFTGRDLVRIVEPGEVELWVGASSTDIREVLPLELVGREPRGRGRPGAGAGRHRRDRLMHYDLPLDEARVYRPAARRARRPRGVLGGHAGARSAGRRRR